MSEKFYVGRDLVDFADNGQRRPISRVTLMLDDETCYTAGDDTGAELIANCVFATQAMANNMLATLKGYVHKAFNAEAANIDPAAELGDGVTAMGIYSVFSEISDDGYGYPNIQASGERILEEEYNNGSPLQISINRKVAKAKAELRVDIDSITARVEGEGGLADQFTELKVTLDGVTVTDSTGTTLIKGSSIETDTLRVNAANVRGTLTAVTVDSSTIKGSTFASILDARGNVGGEIKMQYLADGLVAGGMRLDDQGAGTDEESRYRMYLYTENLLGTPFALKIKSAGNMSISSDADVYIKSGEIHLNGNVYINGELFSAAT